MLGWNLFSRSRIVRLEPVGYLTALGLMRDARLVLTDSGGVQEETTGLGVPRLTLRTNTERPITIEEGTNELVGRDREVMAKTRTSSRPAAREAACRNSGMAAAPNASRRTSRR